MQSHKQMTSDDLILCSAVFGLLKTHVSRSNAKANYFGHFGISNKVKYLNLVKIQKNVLGSKERFHRCPNGQPFVSHGC